MAVLRRENGRLYDEQGREVPQNNYYTADNEIPGQMSLVELPDSTTDIYDSPEKYDLIEQDGSPVNSNEHTLTTMESGALTSEDFQSADFFKYLKERPQQLLDFLLSQQSNTHPLKKGGDGIAYKCEALILGTRVGMSDHENLLFDMILATVSSLPENDVYTIYLSDVMKFLPYNDTRYVERIFKEAKDGLSKQRVQIRSNSAGLDAELDLPLVGPGIFKGANETNETDKGAFYSFTLEPMTKALMISSGFTHGAYYKVEWSAKLRGYAKRLFFWLESIKNYKAYPDAVPGVMYIDIEHIRDMLDIPSSYKDSDIKTKILDYSLKKINAVEGIDIQAECRVRNAKNSKKTVGYLFTVRQVKDIKEQKKTLLEDKERDSQYQVEIGILKAYQYSEGDISAILDKYSEYKRNIQFLTQAVTLVENVSSQKQIASRKEYLCAVLKNGIITGSGEKEKSAKRNSFHNFSQREYDYDDLEQTFLNLNK